MNTTTSTNNFDNLLDEALLEGFDVDAAVAAHQKKNGAVTVNQTSSNKRLRMSEEASATPFASASDSDSAYPSASNSSDITSTATTTTLTSATFDSLEDTLQHYYGYRTFRRGQKSVLKALLQKQDVAVFWATGAGKSLCFQIPPLYLNKVAIVVSPLISLMQDQVRKLNHGLSTTNNNTHQTKKIATYLGSGQLDPVEERIALQGDYRLVYVTPEKLMSHGFLSALAHMHQTIKELCLIAIDESHCVSEWGHDFRPEYRNLSQIRQSNDVLAKVPMIALTATATCRVQTDIIKNLGLRQPTVVRQTFDRDNLRIHVMKKPNGGGGYRAAFAGNDSFTNLLQSNNSTIVYAPTRDLVDEIALFLQQLLGEAAATNTTTTTNNNNNILEYKELHFPAKNLLRVQAYHAGLSQDARKQAHTNFLVGKTQVIVATTAFGMGIDKSDTRCIVHWGAPKTMEEYSQQIGRAGRDGLMAQCFMFVGEADFDRYKSDFYTGSLNAAAKQTMFRSIDCLRTYALDLDKCRRRMLLEFFDETPAFGERCGTCDNCRRVARYGTDHKRDFGPLGARLVLEVIHAIPDNSLTSIEKVVAGNKVEDYRYRNGCTATTVQESIRQQRRSLSASKFSAAFFRELVTLLTATGYVEQGTKTSTVNGFSRTWTTYNVSSQGIQARQDPASSITLPVPQSLRDAEKREDDRRRRILKDLEAAGVRLEQIPKGEIETGDGQFIRAFSTWHGYLDRLQRNGSEQGHRQCQNLFSRIAQWRSNAAVRNGLAPASIMAEHLMATISYTVATMKFGLPVERDTLVACGVRSNDLDSLVKDLNAWVEEFHASCDEEVTSATIEDTPMVFLPGTVPHRSRNPWKFAIYKAVKKTGLASWESSYNRFHAGENPQTIAMSPTSGRPIQVATVVGHILEAIVHGRAVPLQRLTQFSTPPTMNEWKRLEEAERETEMDVTSDPNTSGRDGGKFTLTEFLRPIMGNEFVDTPSQERSAAEKEVFGQWCEKLKWYMTLRRVDYVPIFVRTEQSSASK